MKAASKVTPTTISQQISNVSNARLEVIQEMLEYLWMNGSRDAKMTAKAIIRNLYEQLRRAEETEDEIG